tara:strand:- start:325 stop:960 length:636 start_codon:yes stop_codon:yes gene_type:complete
MIHEDIFEPIQGKDFKEVMLFDKYRVDEMGNIYGVRGARLIPTITTSGHAAVFVRGKMQLAHRLVMEAFHGESDQMVLHLNGVKYDNRLENLRYGDWSDVGQLIAQLRASSHKVVTYSELLRKHVAARSGHLVGMYDTIGDAMNGIDEWTPPAPVERSGKIQPMTRYIKYNPNRDRWIVTMPDLPQMVFHTQDQAREQVREVLKVKNPFKS